MTRDQAKVGMDVRSIVNPDRHYRIISLYETYAKVRRPNDRLRVDLNIDYEYLTPLETTSK